MTAWLWLYGASGTGKTVVGCELFRRLTASGQRTAYVDLDQLGMCWADPEIDPDGLKAANLLSMLRTFGDAGAELVVVSGDIAGPAMDDVIAQTTASPPLLCRLRATPAALVERLRGRGAPEEYEADALSYELRYDVPGGELAIDTSELSVGEVATEILASLGDRTGRERRALPAGEPHGLPPRDVLLICGPTAVGKSDVAWQLAMRSVGAGVPTAFLDLAQIGFTGPAHDGLRHELAARNAAALWENFAGAGATRLILCGDIGSDADVERYRAALRTRRITVALLTADRDTLFERAMRRGEGKATRLPCDDLLGRSQDELHAVAKRAATRSLDLEAAAWAAVHVPTSGSTAAEVAEEIWARAGL